VRLTVMRSHIPLAVAAAALILLGGCGAGRSTGPAGASAPATARSVGTGTASPGTVGPTGSGAPVATPIQPPNVPPGSGTGIAGVVVVVGGCPVERAEPPCPERPLSVRLIITDAATNATVASVTSDADGIFRVAVAPGRYVIRSATPTGPLVSRGVPVSVDVQANRYASVKVQFRSGIQ